MVTVRRIAYEWVTEKQKAFPILLLMLLVSLFFTAVPETDAFIYVVNWGPHSVST
jgi:hypothetical protein